MEDFKELVSLVNTLPEFALWAVVLFWFYKVFVIGSIYGVLRLAINRAFSWSSGPRLIGLRGKLDSPCMREAVDPAITQFLRLLNRDNRNTYSNYIHPEDIDWLRQAIDTQTALDKGKK